MKKIKSAADGALQLISQRRIKPIPKWEFRVVNSLIWIISGLSVLTGAAAVSILGYMIQANDWDLYYFPYFWLIVWGLFIIAAQMSYRKTKKGYRWGILKIAAISLLLSLGLGLVLVLYNFGEKLDGMIAREVPIYREIAPLKYQKWMNPESGLLAGKIYKVNDHGFTIIDFNGNSWEVSLSDRSVIKNRVELRAGEEIKIIGQKIDWGRFVAEEIRPWLNRFGY